MFKKFLWLMALVMCGQGVIDVTYPSTGSCYQTTVDNQCCIACNSGYSLNLGMQLDMLVHANSQCRQGLLFLVQAQFLLGIMTYKWLNSNVNIYEMEVTLEDTTIIEDGAFNSPALSQTEFLTLENLNVSNLSSRTFIGFYNLRTLKLYQMHNTFIPIGLLSGVRYTLENLVVFGDFLNVYNISGMTNGATMSRLELVTYSLNLKDTIDQYSFTGLTQVQTLELSSCAIEVIGLGAFDPIASTLKLLKLNNNNIKHLPDGLFDVLVWSPAKIYLDQNPLECTCALSDLQLQVQWHKQNFHESPTCASPYYLYNVEIDVAEMCVNGIDPMLFNRYIKCVHTWNEKTYKPIKKQKYKFRLVQNVNQSFTLQQLRRWQQEPFVLIFNSTLQRFVPNCIHCREQSHISGRWITLNRWHLHMMCIMDEKDDTISPFDCTSHYNIPFTFHHIWMPLANKNPLVLLFSVVMVLCFVAGLLFGYIALMFVQARRLARKRPVVNNIYDFLGSLDFYDSGGEENRAESRRTTGTYSDEILDNPSLNDEVYVYQSKFDVVPTDVPQLPSVSSASSSSFDFSQIENETTLWSDNQMIDSIDRSDNQMYLDVITADSSHDNVVYIYQSTFDVNPPDMPKIQCN